MMKNVRVLQFQLRHKATYGFWNQKENVNDFFTRFMQENQLTEDPSTWSNITISDISASGGRGLISKYGSLEKLLSTHFPDADWTQLPKRNWTSQRKKITQQQYKSFRWTDIEYQRQFLNQLENSLNYTTTEHWNNLSRAHVIKHGGGRLFQIYSSIYSILTTVFPEKNWEPFKIPKHVPKSHWENLYNQREYFKKLARQKGVSPVDLTKRDIQSHSGNKLLDVISSLYNVSISEHLASLFPLERSRRTLSWRDFEYQKKFMDSMKEKMGIRRAEDWRGVTAADIKNFGGSGLLHYYCPYVTIFNSVYPDVNWEEIFNPPDMDIIGKKNDKYFFEESPSPPAPKNFWSSKENQYMFMEYAKLKFHVETLDDWLKVSREEFSSIGGYSLLRKYNGFFSMLKQLYPNHPWDSVILKSKRGAPPFYWDDFENVKAFVQFAERELYMHNLDDWYRISASQLQELGGGGLLGKYKLYDILCKVYPSHNWNASLFGKSDKRSKQRMLYYLVKNLFQNEEVIEEFVVPDSQRLSGYSVEVDVFVPKYLIGFEYHGEHHYNDIPAFGTLEMHKKRDKEKYSLCELLSIHLVSVPYWWDGQSASLTVLTESQHPSLLFQANVENLI